MDENPLANDEVHPDSRAEQEPSIHVKLEKKAVRTEKPDVTNFPSVVGRMFNNLRATIDGKYCPVLADSGCTHALIEYKLAEKDEARAMVCDVIRNQEVVLENGQSIFLDVFVKPQDLDYLFEKKKRLIFPAQALHTYGITQEFSSSSRRSTFYFKQGPVTEGISSLAIDLLEKNQHPNMPVNMLLDTGMGVLRVSEKYFESKFSRPYYKIPKKIRIFLDDETYFDTSFTVEENLPEGLHFLLGTNTLRQYNGIVDYQNMLVYLQVNGQYYCLKLRCNFDLGESFERK